MLWSCLPSTPNIDMECLGLPIYRRQDIDEKLDKSEKKQATCPTCLVRIHEIETAKEAIIEDFQEDRYGSEHAVIPVENEEYYNFRKNRTKNDLEQNDNYFSDMSQDIGSIHIENSQGSLAKEDKIDILNSLLSSIGLTPFSEPERNWSSYTTPTKQKYLRGFKETITRIVELLFSNETEDVMKDLMNYMSDSVTSVEPEVNISDLDETPYALAESYKSSQSWQIKRQILSVLSVSKSLQEVRRLLPGITDYRYYAAKKHCSSEGCCLPPTEREDIRQRMDPEKLDNFLDFITSSHIVKDLPYGQRKIRTSKGKIIETPNIIRSMAPQAIIKQYTQYCSEQDIEPLGSSTMFRILQNCTATIRKSLEGLDYYLAEGGRSFEELINIVELLEVDESRKQRLKEVILSAKRYLKSDYKVHIKQNSEVADHCRNHALSLAQSQHFSAECHHQHNTLCESCEQVNEIIKDVKELVDKTNFTQRDDEDDIIFRLKHAETAILNWKGHSLRARNQEEAKHDIFQSLDPSSICIVLDWAMKFLPRKYREDTQDWFGKRGISWHISVAFTKSEDGILQSLTFIHIFEGQVAQDATVTTATIIDVLHMLRHQYPQINKVHLWSDNAGCYKSSETISSIFHHAKMIKSYDFCEAQDGKGACDRTAAVIKSSIRRFVNEGNDVMTANQMKNAIERMNKNVEYKVKVVELQIEKRHKFTPIPSISTFNNFLYTSSGLTVWKHYRIGNGKLIGSQSLEKHQVGKLKTISSEKSLVQFHTIGSQRSKGEEGLFTCEKEGCIVSFPTAQQLDDHLILGECDIKAEKERSLDQALYKYVAKLQSADSEQFTLQCTANEGPKDNVPCVGWALKEERKTARFSNKQKEFLEKKFNVGLKSGRKEDPVSVSEEMRKVKDKEGNRLFEFKELLTSQQIASFFSRLCKKSKSAISETLFDEIHAEACQL